MKTTLSTNQVAEALMADDNAGWSYAGARALAEWLEEFEESTGGEMELDVVAIRCDFSEWSDSLDWAIGYFGDDWKEKFDPENEKDEDEIDDEIREYINDNGLLIEFEGGIIVSSF